MRKGLTITVVCASCCCAGLEARAGWVSDVAITNEAAFFDAIDLSRKELADVRKAVAQEDWTAAKVAFEGKTDLPGAFSTVIVPFSDKKEIPAEVEQIERGDSDTVVLRVAFDDGRTDWIAVAPDERELTAGEFSGKGMALCVRTDKDGKQTAREVFGMEPLKRE